MGIGAYLNRIRFLMPALLAAAPAGATGGVVQGRVEEARLREARVMRPDPRASEFVEARAAAFRAAFGPALRDRLDLYRSGSARWKDFYSSWSPYGFDGGFHLALRPVQDVENSFWNPFVYWLWGDVWDENYEEAWYGAEWFSVPVLRTANVRPGVFLPTESMLEFGESASTFTALEQGKLRLGLNELVNRIELVLTTSLGHPVELRRNDVAVTGIELLEGAVALEGFVGSDAAQFGFKGLLSLTAVEDNLLFVPGGRSPTDEEVRSLELVNERIRRLGGVVTMPFPHAGSRRGD